ncbi:MAG: YwiC-like family protein [Propionibacteriaceae bacterium]|nr:YwiC-like family protein [Propionibacteriaceae bacterium]
MLRGTGAAKAGKTGATKPRKRGSQGWVPNHHGAWAMLVVPWVLGFVHVVRHGGDALSSLLMLVVWFLGYFTFFATSQWLKSRFKPRFFPAVRTYAVATAVLGVALLWLRPQWWSWALVFAPLVTLSLWLAWRRRDRSLLSGMSTVAAASMVPLVLGSDGLWPWTVAPEVVGISLVCFGYFFGTVLYVKTLIRERGSNGWVIASVLWHVACVALAFALPGTMPRIAVASFFAIMAVRAWLVPWWGPLSGRTVTAKTAGLGEFAATAALMAVLLIL